MENYPKNIPRIGSENLEKEFDPATISPSVILFTVFTAVFFILTTVSFNWFFLTITVLIGGFTSFCHFAKYYNYFKAKKLINRFDSPIEVIDDFFRWEKQDKLKFKTAFGDVEINALGVRFSAEGFGSKMYFQGVLDDGTIVLSDRKRVDWSDHIYRCNSHFFLMALNKNLSLEDRKTEEIREETKKQLEDSQMMDILEESKRILENEKEIN